MSHCTLFVSAVRRHAVWPSWQRWEKISYICWSLFSSSAVYLSKLRGKQPEPPEHLRGAGDELVPEAPDVVVAHRARHDLGAPARPPGRGVAVAAVVLHLGKKSSHSNTFLDYIHNNIIVQGNPLNGSAVLSTKNWTNKRIEVINFWHVCVGTYLRLVVVNTESAAAPDAGEGKVVVQSEDLLCVVQTLDQSGLICTPERQQWLTARASLLTCNLLLKS